MIALYLPGSSTLPRWVQVTVGIVLLGLIAARIWLTYRRRK
ncbi:hypothetical protein [Streptomyces sp.]|nr:hypothetical protein [Streptomyces sp.]